MNTRTKKVISVTAVLTIAALALPVFGFLLVHGPPWLPSVDAKQLIRDEVQKSADLLRSDIEHIKEQTNDLDEKLEAIRRQNTDIRISIGRIEEKLSQRD